MDRIFLADRQNRRGAALVILLAFVLLLSGVVVAFLNLTMISNRLSNSSLRRITAEQLALSATDIIFGDLKQEIVNGSNATTVSNGATIYRPKTMVNILPARKAPDAIPNLIRRSGDDPPPPAVSSRASSVSSATESLNGRSISATRWNKHYLIPRRSGTDPTNAEPISEFSPPDWVMVSTNEGPCGNPSDPGSVVGRYAYAIYNEGGLLDVNVAGYPTNATVYQYANKPALAYADLTQVGLSPSEIDNLVGWRNYASAKPNGSFNNFTFGKSAAESFFDTVINNTNGFLYVNDLIKDGRTDQALLSRQQLLELCDAIGFNRDALQYLSTFSRNINAPANLDLLETRVTGKFTRSDGTLAQVGEPLLKNRFPLNRIANLTSPSEANIKNNFGLERNGDHWNYFQSSIATISDIGDREPNFFELLKAGIFSYSIKLDSNKQTDSEIIRIGANIIDQYDPDSYPTQIRFNNTAFYGIEDLPYAYSKKVSEIETKLYVSNPHRQFVAPSPAPSLGFRATMQQSDAVYRNIVRIPSEYTIDEGDWLLKFQASPAGAFREYHRIKNLTGADLPDPRTDSRLDSEIESNENVDYHPIVLNRPFRNVGELGYVFRKPPWRNIDFFKLNSTDAGLLDLFCVQETTDENALAAGRINLNTRQAQVLQAILAGAMVAETDRITMSRADAQRIATGLVAFTNQDPLLDRSELVTKAALILNNRTKEKSKGEAALRALSEVGTTRTWNLMIDVIAQTGRYSPGQTNLSKFIVESEKRYWVHVAIDRFTGKVVDKMLEAVYE